MPLEFHAADELFRVTDNNRDYLRQWLPWLDSIKRVEDSRTFILVAQVQSAHNNGTQLAIRLHQDIVGIVEHVVYALLVGDWSVATLKSTSLREKSERWVRR